MDLEMVLNELSLRPLASDEYSARQRMAELIQTLLVATASGVKKVLRTASALDTEYLAPGYPIARWRNDPQVDRDTKRFFLTLTTKAPFLVDINDNNVQDSFVLSDFFFGTNQAIGLGVAYLLDGLAISFHSDYIWFKSLLQLRINELDDSGTIAEIFEDIRHASTSDHILEHRNWIAERLLDNQKDIHEGIDILKRKEEWFPHLSFCENAVEQMQALYKGNLMLVSVIKWLRELEKYCNEWSEGPFDQYQISNSITLEGPPTLEMFGKERTFLCPDGLTRTFSWHVKMTPNEWRMYFFPLTEDRKLIIGYIGPHLRTVSYR